MMGAKWGLNFNIVCSHRKISGLAPQYAQRAGNFANVWNPNITVPDGPASVLGMMQVRSSFFHVFDGRSKYRA